MNTRVVYALIAVGAILVVGLLVYSQNNAGDQQLVNNNQSAGGNVNTDDSALENANLEPIGTNTNTTSNNNNSNASLEGTFSDGSEMEAGTVHQISYDGSRYIPSTLTIKQGDIVVFRNNSSTEFWPASSPHPQHTNYPEFDPKQGVAPGGTYEFKFTKTGAWSFHDHLRPAANGRITVQ